MAGADPKPIETRVGVLMGWRCWFTLPDEGLLRPIYMRGLIWKPREPFEARCPEQVHAVPAEGCKCGIWAVCHPMLLNEVQWTQAPPKGIERLPGALVVGQVALWGSIIEHERGWRAQFAYPSQLYALTDNELLAQRLRERYLVPVAWGSQAQLLEQVLPPQLRNLRQARQGAAAAKRAAFSDVPAIPCAMPTIVEMIHAQELARLTEAREALAADRAQETDELAEARSLLTLEQERVEKLRDLVVVDRQRLREERKATKLERERLAMEQERVAISVPPRPRGRDSLPHYGQQAALKKQLQERGITQGALANFVGVSRTMVVNLLAGRTTSARIHVAAQRLLSLRDRLTKIGWSQNELARQIEKDPGLVSRVIRGEVASGPVWEAIERALSTEAQQCETTERAAELKALNDRLRERGITRRLIASESGVSSPHVTNVLKGRCASAPVIAAARRLLGEAAT